MDSSGNSTLDRIQKEIKETLEREDELKIGHSKLYNDDSETIVNDDEVIQDQDVQEESPKVNGTETETEVQKPNGVQKSNGFRRFTPNTSTKGVMHKFFKTRGKVAMSPLKTTEIQNGWIDDSVFQPAKFTVEKGKPLRNGYVPAEEKIVKELQEFKIREAELRKERRKSQPNLMAALELEESEIENGFTEGAVLKPAKSMASLYQPEEEDLQQNHSAPCSLKPARSLAALCDLSDDEIETPGTYSLIMQFENMKSKEARA